MKKIKLTKGKYAIVDDEDYSYLNRFRWVYTKGVFATLIREAGRYVLVPMGHFLMKSKSNAQINHKNNDDLDFRKSNLMYVFIGKKTHRGKKRKSHFGRKCTSKYKGISKREGRRMPWSASIQKDKIHYRLGVFKTEKEAALAYNKKAKELYGEFAFQNKL